jgi:hypothetical protein
MSLKKYKKVIVKNSDGEKEFMFRPVIPDEDVEILVCDKECPYGINVCSKLPHPEFLDDENKTFQDFCIGVKDDYTQEDYYTSSIGYVPQKGTIEDNMADVEGFQRIIKRHYVDIKDVIRTICCDICDRYRDDFKNCTSDYSGCILHDLLQKTNLNGKNEQD